MKSGIFTRTVRSIVLTSLMMLMLSACGWRLRGFVELPENMQNINLILLQQNYEFERRLQKSLQSAGAKLVKGRETADISLTVIAQERDRNSIAVDSQGRSVNKEIEHSVTYNLQDNDGDMLAEQAKVKVLRIYRYDPDNVLGMEREEQKIDSDLLDELVVALINRVKQQVKNIDFKVKKEASKNLSEEQEKASAN